MDNLPPSPPTSSPPNTPPSPGAYTPSAPPQNTSQPPVSPPTPPAVPSVPPTSSGPPKFLLITFILFMGAIVVGIGVLAFQYFSKKPEDILADAFTKTAKATSFTFKFTADYTGTKVNLDGNIHKDGINLSSLTLTLSNLNKDPTQSANADLIGNTSDLYFKMTYSKINEIISELQKSFPGVDKLKTYTLVYPVITGSKWLHFPIPKDTFTSKSSITPTTAMDQKQAEKLVNQFKAAVIIRQFDRSFKSGGVSYTKITMGLDKEKLITAVESLKNTNIDIKVSQINQLVKSIQSINNWNSDLLTILISNSTGYISELDLNIPEIPKEALNDALQSTENDNSSLLILKNFSDPLQNIINKQPTSTLQHVGTITMSNFNNAPAITPPQDLVEFKDLSDAASTEIMPLIGAMMMGGKSPLPGTLPSQNLPQTGHFNTLPVYTYPTVAPGAPGSPEWNQNFMQQYNQNQNYVNQKQQEVEKAQAQFCQQNPGLCAP